MTRLLCFLLLLSFHASAQPPAIKYPGPQIFIVNKNNVYLSPGNTGGNVPAVIHNEVSTFAGSGLPGGDDGIGTSATFQNPAGLTTDYDGNLYVADSQRSTIRKITPNGRVTTIAGGGTTGKVDGPGATATFFHIAGLAIDDAGNLYIADSGNALVRKIAPDGQVTTYAGDGTNGRANGPKENSSFDVPAAIAVDIIGNIYLADHYNHMIRKISPAGIVSTLAGSGGQGFADGSPGSATFNNPWGLAADHAGNVYVADYNNHLIRKIAADGKVSTIAGTRAPGSADGPASSAGFNNPIGIATDRFENIYVADFLNHKIRKITPGGYTIDKPLPEGLVFDPRTGIITGKPREVWPATDYTITAYNAYGNSTSILSIEVSESLVSAAKIPSAFSPNQDGKNDTWVIGGLV